MRIIEAARITDAVKRLCIRANRELPEDVRECLRSRREAEPWPLARDTLDKIISNFELASSRQAPICQDTGMACVFLEIGEDVHVAGGLYAAVDEGVRQGYREGYLRKSVVADPLNRVNTGDNTPAMVYLDVVRGDRLGITVAPKGFGSENMSQIRMLRPSDGEAGVVDFVVSVVEAAGSNPCPPIVVGVGVGGTFDKAALLAKKALLRPIGKRNRTARYRDLEQKLLARINALGIGPQGFGGAATALSVAVEAMPTHIAGLPCAVNINCHVARHAGEEL
ncbi:MAG: fumarate hydratase [Spirochaetaceae bacterium]|jgi:fumarate hydratase subunit alpha|nr:fumarate hydratase [Spirochaetaceae bacterium]